MNIVPVKKWMDKLTTTKTSTILTSMSKRRVFTANHRHFGRPLSDTPYFPLWMASTAIIELIWIFQRPKRQPSDSHTIIQSLSFSLKNANATYQWAMTYSMIASRTTWYAFGKSKEVCHHIVYLRKVFSRCRQYNLWMSPLKCAFRVSSQNFLGSLSRENVWQWPSQS